MAANTIGLYVECVWKGTHNVAVFSLFCVQSYIEDHLRNKNKLEEEWQVRHAHSTVPLHVHVSVCLCVCVHGSGITQCVRVPVLLYLCTYVGMLVLVTGVMCV